MKKLRVETLKTYHILAWKSKKSKKMLKPCNVEPTKITTKKAFKVEQNQKATSGSVPFPFAFKVD